MPQKKKPDQVNINYRVKGETRQMITELAEKDDRGYGEIVDRMAKIAYPVLLGEAEVKPVAVVTE